MNTHLGKTRALITSFCVLILLTLSFASLNGLGLRLNVSESLPHILYLSTVIEKPELGQVVDFQLPNSQVTFAKIIAGVPGDVIHIQYRKIYINNTEIGEVIEPFESISEGTIPVEHFFVMGTHPESFDSRYKMFGLVHRDWIKEKLCPIF